MFLKIIRINRKLELSIRIINQNYQPKS